MSTTVVRECLRSTAYGSYGYRIAKDAGVPYLAVEQAISYMARRGQLEIVEAGRTLMDSIWRLPADSTPPVFHALETLTKFQQATHKVTTDRQLRLEI
ncbi:hypothetical protein [Burkholderia glumae]|uniref:hypothetical protein n=1 Tax=Burkholderia glumae TaxID=337 RepID=UPI003B9B6BF8